VQLPLPGAPGYAAAVRAELAAGEYLAVLPASDVVLMSLETPGAALVDKVMLADRAAEAAIPTIAGTVFGSATELRAAAGELRYPVVVKPTVKSAGPVVQAQRIDHAQQLVALEPQGTVVVQSYVSGPLRAVTGVVWGGEFLALGHQRYLRLWPRHAGVGSAAITVEPDLHLEGNLLRLLKGHDGLFQAQFIGQYLLDVNPRAFGSLPLSVAAGANLPAIACNAARGRQGPLVRTRPGVRYRWLEGDLRHLAAAARSGDLTQREVVRQLLPRRGTAHSVESVSDPGPIVSRLAYALRKPR
jgi:predicted ATP-grasp superfamily ATP-dependent carboligase